VPERRELTLIGVGAGSLQHLTAQAIAAVAATDVFVVIDKGSAAELAAARRAVVERHAPGRHRIVEITDPVRARESGYVDGVADWHAARAERLEAVLLTDVGAGERAGVLVWGDPSWYDSNIRLVEAVVQRGRVDLDWSVVPGVSSIQLLAAAHRLVLNRVGSPVLVTTGRRIAADGVPTGIDDVVVFLDGEHAFTTLVGQGWDLYWGAYLGMAGELLVAGPVDEVADRVIEARTSARAARGWVFDLYLLRRRVASTSSTSATVT
jgi:precorrin-6A synthase